MEKFVHQQNLLVLRKQLATTPNEAQRLQLSRLLAEEEEKILECAAAVMSTVATKRICENHQSMFAFGGKAGTLNYITTASAGPIVSAQLTLWSASVRYKICRGFDRCA